MAKTKSKSKTEDDRYSFKCNNKDYYINSTNFKIKTEAEKVYAKAFREAVTEGYYLEAEIQEILSARGLDSKSLARKADGYLKEIRDAEVRLVNEEYDSPQEGRNIALSISELRDKINSLDNSKNELNSMSADNYAENRRLSYIACSCVVDEKENKLWADLDEFLSDQSELAQRAGIELLLMNYDRVREQRKEGMSKFTENQWLKDNGFVDEDLNFIDEKGRLIDVEGRLINEDGEFINEDGDRVDIYGNPLDEDGQPINPSKQVKEQESATKTTKQKPKEKPTNAPKDKPKAKPKEVV